MSVMRTPRVTRWVRGAGFGLGLTLAFVAVTGFGVPRGWGHLGASFTLVADRTGPLGVTPAGIVLQTPDQRPGKPAVVAGFALRNQTAAPLAVSVRLAGPPRDLANVLHIEVSGEGHPLYRGALGGLRQTTPPIRIASAQAVRISMRVWIPETVRHDYQGRIVRSRLVFDAGPASA